MAQICDICGKGPRFGNNISHAHNVTRRRWNVNLQVVKAAIRTRTKADVHRQTLLNVLQKALTNCWRALPPALPGGARLLWLAVKTEGPLEKGAVAMAARLWWPLLLVAALFLFASQRATSLF